MMHRGITAVALCLSVASCQSRVEAAPVPALPVPAQQEELVQREQTVFELDQQRIVVRKEDAEEIRAQLLAQLAKQKLEHQDLVLQGTRGTSLQFHEDAVRIGQWWLQDVGGLRAMIRLGPGASPAYAADVAKPESGWSVSEISPVRIHPR